LDSVRWSAEFSEKTRRRRRVETEIDHLIPLALAALVLAVLEVAAVRRREAGVVLRQNANGPKLLKPP
jgi:hypothetical protein